jgi:hypothetical protein
MEEKVEVKEDKVEEKKVEEEATRVLRSINEKCQR